MDERVTLSKQMEENNAPVILINKFSVKPEEADQLLKAWAEDAAHFKQQPGIIFTQLHRGIGGSSVFVNVAVWESVDHYNKAFNSRKLESLVGHYPPGTTVSPHLFENVEVPGICVK